MRQKIAYGIATKGNGDAFATFERHMPLSVGGGQAGQGYPCVMVIEDEMHRNRFVESYDNRKATMTLTNARADQHHLPCVYIDNSGGGGYS